MDASNLPFKYGYLGYLKGKFMGSIACCDDSSMKLDLMSGRDDDEIEVNVSVSCD